MSPFVGRGRTGQQGGAGPAEPGGSETQADTCRQREEQTRQARRGLSDDYHPFDLDTGVPREADEVQRRLQQRFDQIEKNAGEAGLSEGSYPVPG